ncbi:MAG TPA: DUF3379 family protein [Myxococcota bacterium]|nr:DUF3379 family protein [Myxococcota bacterium]
MNCLDFRREALADPRGLTGEAEAHAAQCPPCSQFRSEAAGLDKQLHAGFAVPVPEGLAQRVAANARAAGEGSRRRFLALAASLVLGTGIGAGAYIARRDDPLALAGIDFVIDEEVNAILRSKPPDPSALRRVARTLEVDLPPQLGEMRYIGICPFQGTIAHHVVVITPRGKATLLLLPERPVDARARASSRGLRAVVLPAGPGSLAIIGGSSGLERIERMVRHG